MARRPRNCRSARAAVPTYEARRDAFCFPLGWSCRPVPHPTYFPNGAPTADDLRITFRAGYATADSPDVEAVPASIKQAIRLMVGDMWAFRETVALGQVNEVPSSATVKNLLAPFRIIAA